MLMLGHLRIFYTNGSAIHLEYTGSELAHLVMPYRKLAPWHRHGHGVNYSAGQSLAYANSGPIQIETKETAEIITFVEPEALRQTALSMVGGDLSLLNIQAALASPRLIALDTEAFRQLAHVLYSLYESLGRLLSAGDEILRHSRIEDQILRVWVLLLIPELHSARTNLSPLSPEDKATV